jgi:hypothetical protein
MGREGVYWRRTFVNTVMNLRVPQQAGNFSAQISHPPKGNGIAKVSHTLKMSTPKTKNVMEFLDQYLNKELWSISVRDLARRNTISYSPHSVHITHTHTHTHLHPNVMMRS